MNILQGLNLPVEQFVWLLIIALSVGFSKTGISGVSMLAIPIVATVFGGRASTGIMLPMLIVGDVFAVKYYNRHSQWEHIKKLLPWALAGLVLGTIVGNYINDRQFKILIAICVLFCLGIMLYTEKKGGDLKVPDKLWFYALTGIASGFTSMIGNAAAPIMSIYLLAKGYKKNGFLGTYSWFFLVINCTKVPIQVLFWQNISLNTLLVVAVMIPAITIGAFMGVYVVKRLNEKLFRTIFLVMTAVAAIKLLF